jgi:hypothetical protein
MYFDMVSGLVEYTVEMVTNQKRHYQLTVALSNINAKQQKFDCIQTSANETNEQRSLGKLK